MSTLTCQQPDRDVPRIVCGYPLPCPHHTAVIDLAARSLTLPAAPSVPAARALADVAAALTDPPRRRRRRRS